MTSVIEIDNNFSQEDDFLTLYAQFKRKVLNTALNIVHNLEDAEEITQDVFLTLYFEKDKFKGSSSVGTWIYRITINKSYDLLKKKKRKKRFAWFTELFDPLTGKELHVIPDFYHPGILLEHKEDTELLFLCLEQLPEKQKTALILSSIEHLSYEEIKEIMNTSTSAVESLIFRARKNLKKILGKRLYEK